MVYGAKYGWLVFLSLLLCLLVVFCFLAQGVLVDWKEIASKRKTEDKTFCSSFFSSSFPSHSAPWVVPATDLSWCLLWCPNAWLSYHHYLWCKVVYGWAACPDVGVDWCLLCCCHSGPVWHLHGGQRSQAEESVEGKYTCNPLALLLGSCLVSLFKSSFLAPERETAYF